MKWVRRPWHFTPGVAHNHLLLYRHIKCALPRMYKPCEKSLLILQLINNYNLSILQ